MGTHHTVPTCPTHTPHTTPSHTHTTHHHTTTPLSRMLQLPRDTHRGIAHSVAAREDSSLARRHLSGGYTAARTARRRHRGISTYAKWPHLLDILAALYSGVSTAISTPRTLSRRGVISRSYICAASRGVAISTSHHQRKRRRAAGCVGWHQNRGKSLAGTCSRATRISRKLISRSRAVTARLSRISYLSNS